MFDPETNRWVFSTLAQTLAALIGLFFYGLLRYSDEWRKLFTEKSSQVRDIQPMIAFAEIADKVRDNAKKFGLFLTIGVGLIVADMIALVFPNIFIFVGVLVSNFIYMILLVNHMVKFVHSSLPTGEEFIKSIPKEDQAAFTEYFERRKKNRH